MKSETETREQIIDKKLRDAGWDVDNLTQVTKEFDIPVTSIEGPSEFETLHEIHHFSDYVLLGKDAKPLAVIEAKKSSKDAAIGREQAKQYCIHIHNRHGGMLPFCFYTNGHEIYYWDIGNYPPRKVIGFPTRDDLERFKNIRDHKKPLADELINTEIAGRPYQIHAIRAVMEGINRKKRNFLLVMATGTGKTRTCIALIDALMRAGYVERVLFLVDRIALRDQGLAAFKEYLPNEPRWPKKDDQDIAQNRRIYVATYPTMLNIIRDKNINLSPHFFDLVVVDESHRSIYNTYGEVLQYFNAINIGLTATPTDIIDHNTFKLFNCENGVPTFAYTYEEAVKNKPPYLCNFCVLKIHTKFQEEGINKRTISRDDLEDLIREGIDTEKIKFEGTELEKTVINKGTNTLIVREFMEESIKDSDGVRPGKTIFFCCSVSHARRIEQIFDALYPEYNGELAKVLVSDDPRVYGKGGLLDQFTNNDMPRIALSVDMLDTGIDIREIVNLTFAKPVFSYTKFWQMIGRGTRLLESRKIKPWCTAKETFLILDCWNNFDYFKENPEGIKPTAQIPLPVRFVELRINKIEKAIGKDNLPLAEKEIKKLQEQIQELPAQSVIIQEAASDIEKIKDDSFWTKLTPSKIEFLRTTINPLFRTLSQIDFKKMRFEKDILEASLAKLSDEKEKFELLKNAIIGQISELPLSVNIVAKEETLIKHAQTDNFWLKATDDTFDELAERLSGLMKYRDEETPPWIPAQFDLIDSINVKTTVEFGPEHSVVSVSKYREMVEKRIRELIDSIPVLRKIQMGKEITTVEIDELASRLYNEYPHITEDLLKYVYNNRKAHFIQFIRHILGLERLESFPEIVTKAFDQFIRSHSNLSTRQLDFLQILKNFIVEKEIVKKRDLIESPFTLIHPQGIRGLFSTTEINEILNLTNRLAV